MDDKTAKRHLYMGNVLCIIGIFALVIAVIYGVSVRGGPNAGRAWGKGACGRLEDDFNNIGGDGCCSIYANPASYKEGNIIACNNMVDTYSRLTCGDLKDICAYNFQLF